MAPMFQQHVPTSCLRWSWSLHGLEVDCSLCRSGTSKAAPESWSYFVCWQLWRKLALICLRPKNCCFSVCVCPVHSTSGFLFRKAYSVKFHLKSFEGIILKANCHKDELIPWRFTRSCTKAFNEWWHKRSSCQAKRTNSLAISNYQSVVALGKLPMLCQGLISPVLSNAIKSNTHVGEAKACGFRLDLEKNEWYKHVVKIVRKHSNLHINQH